MKSNLIIGLSGQAGVGKDTVASILVKHFNLTQIAFADVIKRSIMDWWDLTPEVLWGSSELRNKPDKRYFVNGEYLSARKLLQVIGTDISRKLDNDVWCRYTINLITKLSNNHNLNYDKIKGIINQKNSSQGFVISDNRFQNEFNLIKKKNGLLVRVKREHSSLDSELKNHLSEKEMSNLSDDKFDIIIDNNSSVEDLEHQILTKFQNVGLQPIQNKQLSLKF